ncbi:hypothetical protein QBC47DRAFT_438368 [Echria macrotheca]|uniref:Peptidase S9 prolyl oligopeptidase catalytic domain-containing protein n=1 Tax=Echria macrotheca TaxID=438768 RepID=A0AAJ0BKQ2_9PEZI|nr:hypothetical protein QBC47DRAFT_438368 [Echria macrotheca]
MAPITKGVFPKLVRNTGLPDQKSGPEAWFELYFNGRTLKYTVEIVGNHEKQPAAGFPLYICLHGGGGGSIESGNSDWNDVVNPSVALEESFFRGTVAAHHAGPSATEPAVLVFPRGISSPGEKGQPDMDLWFLHHVDETFPLYETMIVHLLKHFPPDAQLQGKLAAGFTAKLTRYQSNAVPPTATFVDANRVYLWGFSAGGDGAFHIATKIPDRFATVIAAAGHPEGTRFVNAINIPMILQVGEDDYYESNKWHRAAVYLEAEKKLKEAKVNLGAADTKDTDTYYRYRLDVVKNAIRGSSESDSDWKHNGWSWPDIIGTQQKVLLPTAFDSWRTTYVGLEKQFGVGAAETKVVRMPETAYGPEIVDPIEAILHDTLIKEPTKTRYHRHTIPELVLWDLDWRPATKRHYYWMYLRHPEAVPVEDKKLDNPHRARIGKGSKADTIGLRIYKPNAYMGYLLKKHWFVHGGVTRNVEVSLFDETKGPAVVATLTPQVQAKIEEETLEGTGDPNFQFSAMVYLEPNGSSWTPKLATSLAV